VHNFSLVTPFELKFLQRFPDNILDIPQTDNVGLAFSKNSKKFGNIKKKFVEVVSGFLLNVPEFL
jgi:hypothetical protein